MSSVLQSYVISTDMLSNTTRFTRNNVCLTDIVQQRSLTVVYVTHHGYNRSTRQQVFFCIGLLFNSLSHFGTYIFSFISKFFGHQVNGFCIQTLVDRYHNTYAHTSRNNLSNRNIHHVSQFIGSNELGKFQDFAFFLFQFLLLQLTVLNTFTFFLTIFSSLVFALICQAGQCFLNLFSNIFIAHFLFYNRFLEAIFAGIMFTVIACSLIFAPFIIFSRVGSTVIAGSSYINTLFINTISLFLLRKIVSLVRFFIGLSNLLDDCILHLLALFHALLVFLFPFFPFFLFRFLFRTGRLIQRIQVYLTNHIDFRLKLGRTNLKYFVVVIL